MRIGGEEVYLQALFDLISRWRLAVSFTPRPHHPQGKSPWFPWDRSWVSPRTNLDAVVKNIYLFKETRLTVVESHFFSIQRQIDSAQNIST